MTDSTDATDASGPGLRVSPGAAPAAVVRALEGATGGIERHVREIAATLESRACGWDEDAALDAAAVIEDLARTVRHLQLVAAHSVSAAHDRGTGPDACAVALGADDDGPPLSFGGDAHLGAAGAHADDEATGGAPAGGAASAGSRASAGSTAPADGGASGEDAGRGGPATGGAEPREAVAGRVEARAGRRSPYRSAADGLRVRLRLSGYEARRRIATARDILPGVSLSGAELAPSFPLVGELVADGAGDRDAVGHILRGLHQVEDAIRRRQCWAATRFPTAAEQAAFDASPDAVAEHEQAQAEVTDQVSAAEQILVVAARDVDADSVRRLSDRIVHLVDQDGAEPTDPDLSAQGVYDMGRRRGLHHLRVLVDDVGREILDTVFATATNPRTFAATACEHAAPEAADAEQGASTPPPIHVDRRPVAKLRLDALLAACGAALRAKELPDTGGLPTQVMVTVGLENLRTGLGSAHLPYTGPIQAGEVRRLACDADLIPIVLGTRGQVLDVGRARRLFPSHQRRALVARDGGCAFPGCHIPAPWCEGHHIVEWWRGGRTTVNDGVLLCAYHHHLVHAGCWQITSEGGVPRFHPPQDDGRRRRGGPLRNTYHRPPLPRPRRQ